MSHAKNKVDWCLNKAKKELEKSNKHRGLVKSQPNLELAQEHIKKAEHNLRATIYLKQGGYSDWCSSSLFYMIYHCFLAILQKFGYETRNQECTFAVIQSLIEENKIVIEQKDFDKISLLKPNEAQESSTIVSIREHYQYSTKVTLENKEYEELLDLAKKILDNTKNIIEEK